MFYVEKFTFFNSFYHPHPPIHMDIGSDPHEAMTVF